MKKKEPKKIRLSTAILCLIILVLIGGIIYFAIQNNNLKKTNGETENQIGEFQTQVKELENTNKKDIYQKLKSHRISKE